MATKIITVEATPPAESTGADYYKGAPLNAAEFDQNIVNLRAAVDRKASLNNPTFTGTVTLPSTTSIGDVSATELQYLNSVTSNVQDQINSKQATITTLGTANGGTGLTSFTSGGVVYASSSSALTTGSALTFDGTNLGVGTASPAKKLDVQSSGLTIVSVKGGSALNQGSAYYVAKSTSGTLAAFGDSSAVIGGTPDTSAILYTGASIPLSFYVSGSERMRLDTSGNLGIGTASPSAKLDVSGSSDVAIYATASGVSNALMGFNNSGSTNYAGAPTATSYFGNQQGYPIVFANRAERMRIDSSGNLLVGTTTSPGGSATNLCLGQGARGVSILAYCNGVGFSLTATDTVNAPNDGFIIGHLTTTNALQMRCGTTGGVQLASGGTSWGTISDERLKDIIEPITNATEKVSSLRAVIGKYKNDAVNKRRCFLIAQDVQAVLPEAISQYKEKDDETEYYALQYTDVIPLLVAAIKELSAQNKELTQRIEALEYKG